MFSLRSIALMFCSSIAIFCMLQLPAFDSYIRLRTTFATNANSNMDSASKTSSYQNNTLGIASRIYVLSLPARTDRRRDMEHLRKTLGLQWTYIEAIDPQNAIVERIMDSVRLVRQMRPYSVFTWPDEQVSLNEPIDAWDPAFLTHSSTHSDTPSQYRPLVCATQNDTIIPYNPNLPEHKILTGARIACWYSHLSVIYTIANDFALRPDDTVVVLEDDVDMEKDIHRRLRNVWPLLPSDWDIVYLGHCWSDEGVKKPLGSHLNSTIFNGTRLDTYIHPSSRPLCTHAYALSRFGARRLLLHLRYPFFAYSRSIDKAFSWLIESGCLKSFSIVPSVVIQRKVGTSDIMSGKGSGWRAELINGVFGTI